MMIGEERDETAKSNCHCPSRGDRVVMARNGRSIHRMTRRGHFGLLAAMVLSGALFLGAVSSAYGASSHKLSSSFASLGTGAGQVSLATSSGVAVNATTHDIYVADTNNRRVDQFDASGAFIRAWGWGVADGIGEELQSCSLTCFAGLSGSGAGAFEVPTFIAVDNDPSSPSFGDVYVGDTGDRLVTKFDASGNLISSWGDHENAKEESEPNGQLEGRQSPGGAFLNEFGSSLAGIAVDTSGNLWVYVSNSRMVEFGEGGGFVQEWGGPGARPSGIAVDGAQSLFVENGFEQIEKLTSEGIPIGPLTPTPEEGSGVQPPTGLAVDQARGDIYVDTGQSVRHISRACNPAGGACQTEETLGSRQLIAGAGVGVDAVSGAVYVADAGTGVISVFTPALEVDTGPASSVTASVATVSGSVDPEGSPATGCHFEYGETEEYGAVVACAGVSELTEPTGVQAEVTGLVGGTTYHYRLVAKNGAGGTVFGEDATFSTPPTAVIASLATANLTGGSAELQASVNPVGIPVTSCLVEYGTSSAYGQTVPCDQSPEDIGSGNSPVPVSVTIGGLAADTTYHWRLLVADENGFAESPDQTFVYSTVKVALSDGREYEMVTPVQKNGALVGKLFAFIAPRVSTDGERLIAVTDQCFPGAPSCVGNRQNEGAPYEFMRSNAGWAAHSLAPPATLLATNSYWSFNPDAGTALFSVPSPPAGQDDFYAREPAGAFVPIGPLGEGPKLGNYENLTKEGLLSTADLSHLTFETQAPAWSFDSSDPSARGLYVYSGRGNSSPLLVGVTGASGSASLISKCGTRLGNFRATTSKLNHPLSDDGRTIVFTAARCESGSGVNEGVAVPAAELYARIDGERGDAHTVLISGPVPGGCTTPECEENTSAEKQSEHARDASFEGATSDNSMVVFTDTQQLTDDATQDPATNDSALECTATTNEESGCNLYVSICPFPCAQPDSERQLINVSAGAQGGGPRVQGILAVSSDGSHIYFIAKGTLTEAPNSFGQRASGGAENLYVYERDAAFPQGHLAFIASLASGDSFGRGTANVTPSGKQLVFISRRGLTPDATRATGPAQVYEYDDEKGVLTRISIGQNGFNNNGNSGLGSATVVAPAQLLTAASVPQRTDPTMSHDGSFVFFQSPIALTPEALDDVEVGSLNGEPVYAQNVYEYHDGKVSLISDGKDVSVGVGFPPSNVELLGSDASGANVFFSTADSLVPEDTDTQLDIYDAHACSAAQPCLAPKPSPALTCEGEACHGTYGGAPSQPAPGSATFSGVGNLPPTSPAAVRSKPPTRAQKLAKALHACHSRKNRRKRAQCEAQARKRYGAHRARKAIKPKPKRGHRK